MQDDQRKIWYNTVMRRILVIEDDAMMLSVLVKTLEDAGYATRGLAAGMFRNAEALLKEVLNEPAELILLDLHLGEVDGVEILKEIRAKRETPVMILTRSQAEADEVLTMSYGADDFVTKPYSPQVLLLRIAAIMRRTTKSNNEQSTLGDITIDLRRGLLEKTGKSQHRKIYLTKNEMIILGQLLKHRNEIVLREVLMTDLWNNHEYINDNALTVNVSRLRSKFAELGVKQAIVTRKGVGYILQ